MLLLMKTAIAGPPNHSELARKRWATVLRQASDPDSITDHLISRRLIKAIDQVDDLEKSLIDMKVDSALFHNDLIRLRKALSPSRLGEKWLSVAESVAPEVLKSLAWQNWVVGSKEEPIDEAALNDLKNKISDLIKSLDVDSGLPQSLVEQIRRQLVALEDSLIDYAITGVGPISKELKNCIVDIVENSEELKEVMSSENKKAKDILHKFADAVFRTNEAVQSTGKTAAAVNSLMNFGKEVFKLLSGS